MLRFLVKTTVYFGLLLGLMVIGLLPQAAILSILLAAAVLAAVNTLIRPVLVALALPLNLLTFGIASVFANLLSLVIANAIVGGTLTTGFWAMLLTALVIMLADDCIRLIRRAIKMQRASANA